MIKKCKKCGEDKVLGIGFRVRNDRPGQYQAYCIECNKAYQKEHYKANKKTYTDKAKNYKIDLINMVREIKKATPCKDCGNKYHYCQMDFDHVRGIKSFNISRSIWWSGIGKKQLIDEIEKCEVVCSNCHRIRTFNRITAPSSNG